MIRNWVVLATTNSNNAAWAFDRLRLYYPTAATEVAVITAADGDPHMYERTLSDGRKILMIKRIAPTLGAVQKFSTTNGFEHDFTFDLSSNTTNAAIHFCIRGVPENANWRQLYAYPTGYSATRNKDADLLAWYFAAANFKESGGDWGRIRMNSQPTQYNDSLSYGNYNALYAQEIHYGGTTLGPTDLDNLIIYTEAGNTSGGTLTYSGTPSVAARPAYDALIARSWTINGTAPPTS